MSVTSISENIPFQPALEFENQSSLFDLSDGLLAAQALISPKYFYNKLGSRLFEAICELPEYYLTRTEAEIFSTYRSEIAASVGTSCALIDLGAGNCEKAERLFETLKPAQYVPVDISSEFLQEKVTLLKQKYPDIEIKCVAQDFSNSLQLPAEIPTENRLFFYPGSSIGNFDPLQASEFLSQLHSACGTEGSLLIGVDLRKDSEVLEAAYDDSLGVTASFNLNMLLNLNELLGTDFDPRDWQHRAHFNSEMSRVEMHLEAKRNLTVRWKGLQRIFLEGERIHTENSYKYTLDGFLELLASAGFSRTNFWTDSNSKFLVCHAKTLPAFQNWN